MQAGLSWPEARALAIAGNNVRRAQWADRWIFAPRGVLFWLETLAGTRRIVQAGDFQRPEFLARDWTDAGVDQNKCVDEPPLPASLTLSPSSVIEGGSSTATLSLPSPVVEAAEFSITTHPAGRASHVATVTIPAGSSSVTFTVTTSDVDLPSGIIVTAASAIYGVAQAALSVIENIVSPPPPPPPPVAPWVRRFKREWVAPGDLFSSDASFMIAGPYVQSNGVVIENPFDGPARVSIKGVVIGRFCIFNPSPAITNNILSRAPIVTSIGSTGLEFYVSRGSVFTLFATASGSVQPAPAGFDITVTISA
jgi:hypothetical protein